MLIHHLRFAVCLYLLMLCVTGFSQPTDATGTVPEQQPLERLRARYDSLRRMDSLRRADLLRQIEQLKASSGSEASAAVLRYLKQEQRDDSIARARERRLLEELKQNEDGAPVTPFRDTLFFIYSRFGSFSATHRATVIARRINLLYEDPRFTADSMTLVAGEGSTDIVYGDEVIVSVNRAEALWNQTTTEALAQKYLETIAQAIANEKEQTSFRQVLLRIGGATLIIVAVVLIIRVIVRMFGRLRRRIIQKKDRLARGVRIGNYQFLDAKRLTQVILFLSNILRLTIIALAIYITLPLMFMMFPWTEGLANTLLGWILSPLRLMYNGFANYLPDLFTIVVIIVITHYVLKFFKFIASEIESGALVIAGFYSDWARPTLNIVKILVIAFSFIVIFPYLPGSDSPIFQGVSVFLGLLLSLGSSSAISNMVAGLVITYMRPFRIGDRVKIGDISGDVIEKTVLVTRIRTVKNEDITVPNSAVLSGHTVNYTTAAREAGLILHTSVTCGYGVPWRRVHELLLSAAHSTPSIMTDEQHQPFVLQKAFHDFYVEYQLNAYTQD